MEAIVWAMKARGLTPTAWKLLLKLCDRVNNERNDFDVWPSQKLIAEDCEVSVPTVKRHLQELVDEGYVRVIGQFDPRTQAKTVNRYRIQVRTRAVMPKEFVAIEPEGPATPDHSVIPPIDQSDLGGGVTADLTEPTKLRTYPNEPNPPLPSEEDTPLDELFPVQVVTSKPSIIEYVKAGWSSFCDDFPRTHRVVAWSDSRKKAIARRADEVVRGSGGALDAYQVWDMIFAAMRADRWWRGQADPGPRYATAYAAKIDDVLRPRDFLKILEKANTNERDTAATSDPVTGRPIGPAEQAARGALARFLAGQQQRQ